MRRRATALAVAVACLGIAMSSAGVAATTFELGAPETRDALALGARSITESSFGGEWIVRNSAGEQVTVVTPFHRVALVARHAAFRGEPVKPGETERALRDQRGRLVLLAELRGAREDFARYLAPELRVGDRVVKPAFVQNERTALRHDRGYLARCRYEFPAKDLQGDARVSLVVRDADGHEASAFAINLGAMR